MSPPSDLVIPNPKPGFVIEEKRAFAKQRKARELIEILENAARGCGSHVGQGTRSTKRAAEADLLRARAKLLKFLEIDP